MKCIACGAEAVVVDEDYNEGYCQHHYEEIQKTEPITNLRWL